MGLFAKSTRGLGKLRVRGLRRVPKPPTKIKAFMVSSSSSSFSVSVCVSVCSESLCMDERKKERD